MTINWSWPKVTALATVQAAANTLLTLLVGHAWLEIAWVTSLQASALAGAVAFLRAVVAYSLPQGLTAALVSSSVASAQDAKAAQAEVADVSQSPAAIPPHDITGARGW